MSIHTDKAELLRSLHVPGDPLILTNVWDAASARAVAAAPGVRALATASAAVSASRGVDDGEGLSLDEALAAAKIVIDAVELPVTVDFERGYGRDAAAVLENVTRLAELGAVGLNLEDSPDGSSLVPLAEQAARVAAVRTAAERYGVPLVLNARVDALIRGGSWSDVLARSEAYLAAGADSIFVLGLRDEGDVKRAVDGIPGLVAVGVRHGFVPLARLAALGVARISVGPGAQQLAMARLTDAAERITARGDYPAGLG